MWNGNTTNFEIAALKLGYGGDAMDNLSSDQLTNAKNALIEQYSVEQDLWSSEYTDLQPSLENGDVWVAYSWQDQWVNCRQGHSVRLHEAQPGTARLVLRVHARQGQRELLPRPRVRGVVHQPQVLVSLTNYFYYGSADATIKPSEIDDKAVAKSLAIGNPNILASADVTSRRWEPNEARCSRPGKR